MMTSNVGPDCRPGTPYKSTLSYPGPDIGGKRPISPSFLDMLPAEKQPSKRAYLVAVVDEGCGLERYSLPELKRAASVSIPVRPMAGKQSAGLGKPSFKIELPLINLFSASVSSQGLKSYASTTEITADCRVNTQTDLHHFSCTTDGQAKPLPTPPPESSLPSCKMASSNKDHRDTVANKGTGSSIHQMASLSIESNTPDSTDPGPPSNTPESHPATNSNEGANTAASPLDVGFQDTGSASSYLNKAIEVILSDIPNEDGPGNAIRVLSHTLPCPATNSHGDPPNTAYSTLITAIQNKQENHQSSFISVTHAVPSRFSLADLPTSPPGTPISSISAGGVNIIPEDYFNMSGIFSSAVPVVNHYDLYGSASNIPVPSSPCLAVPPASISITILERLIPPSNVQEFLNLFAQTGQSVLLNRLIELSPNKGTMLFIYPTKAGGTTFASRYLGPILDPVLRTMINSHSLSADIAVDIGKVDAVEHLLSYEGMKRKVNMLLERLNRGSSSSKGSNYALVHSSKENVLVDRRVWTEWFLQQETPRFRFVTTRYFQRAHRLPKEPHVNYAVLTREIVEGITERKYNAGEGPGDEDGIEVGVYVVRRGA